MAWAHRVRTPFALIGFVVVTALAATAFGFFGSLQTTWATAASLPGDQVAAGAWSSKAPIPRAISDHIAETVGGLIYVGQGSAVAGGSVQGEFFRYDPSTDTWELLDNHSDTYARASVVMDGKIYAFGGVAHGGPLATVEVYDPAIGSWTALTSMPTQRAGAAAAVVDGKAYVFGGSYLFGPHLASDTNEVYDTSNDTWESLAPMPRGRASASAAAVGGRIYLFGGVDGSLEGSTVFDIVDVYDPSSNLWSTLPTPMPRSRVYAAIAVINGKILLVGGSNVAEGYLAHVDEFDPETDLWTERQPMPTARTGLAAAVADGRVYAIAGQAASGYVSVVEVYGPVHTCDATDATVVGTDGSDIITGTPGRDVIVGLAGHDVIDGLGGDDVICAGPGSDMVNGGDGNDMIWGQGGSDFLSGGLGDDKLYGNAGFDRLVGNQGHDRLFGGFGRDRISGGAGNDRIWGGRGDDWLSGGDGDDDLNGGPGASDVCDGGPGVNIVVACEP